MAQSLVARQRAFRGSFRTPQWPVCGSLAAGILLRRRRKICRDPRKIATKRAGATFGCPNFHSVMSACQPPPATASAPTGTLEGVEGVSWPAGLDSAYHWLCQARQTAHPNHPVWHFRWNWRTWKMIDDWVILAKTRWQLRRAVRVMNEVLARLGLAQHPDKTFIGRVSRGFDFLGVDFQPGAPLAPSAVSLARKTEKIARLYEHLSSVALAKEEGASQERIGRYETHWARWLRSLTDRSDPAAPAPPARPPLRPTPRLYDDPSGPSHPSPSGRRGALNTSNREDENKTDQDRSFRSQVATGRHGPRGHHRQLAGGHRADHPHGE